MEKHSFKNYLKERLGKKSFVAILIGYILFCLFSAIIWCIAFNAKKLFISLAFIVAIPLIFIAEYAIGIHMNEFLTSMVILIMIGTILGFCFNLYITLPWLDTVMHALSGMLFSGIGFSFAEKFFGKPKTGKLFYGCLVFAICFSFSASLCWEFYEYISTVLTNKDMMADTIVTEIHSGLLSGIHAETLQLNGITKTVIHYENGQSYVINGYLDIGLIDTMSDLIICTIGTAIYSIIAVLCHTKHPRINELLTPEVVFCDEEQAFDSLR